MLKQLAVVLLCVLALPAWAQTQSETVALHYAELAKAKAAVRTCARAEGRMQIERNAHYDALLQANAKDPAAPTIDEMAQALAQVRVEDDAISEKREECEPLFDELASAVRALRRDCHSYIAPSPGDEPTGSDEVAADVCNTSKSATAAKPASQ